MKISVLQKLDFYSQWFTLVRMVGRASSLNVLCGNLSLTNIKIGYEKVKITNEHDY